MNIAISGASGKTGYRIAQEALSVGHSVRLLVRKNSLVPDSLNSCKRINLSIFNSKDLDKALAGSDALIIATGARPSIDLTSPARVDACAVESQVKSCIRSGVKRIILVSSLCAGRLIHPLNLFGLILIWKRVGEKALENSSLNWTIIRPGGLNENENSLELESIIYTQKDSQEEGSIPRRLVAKCCIDALKLDNSIGEIIEITSRVSQERITLEKALKSYNK